MSIALASGTSQNCIQLVLSKDFPAWLSQQNEKVKAWVNSNNYEGKGLLLIPTDDATASAIFGITNLDDFYLAGDLPNQLPDNSFSFDSSSLQELGQLDDETIELVEFRFATSWSLAAYTFTKYKDLTRHPAQLLMADQELLTEASNTASAIYLTRDLVNTPAEDMMPANIAEVMQYLAADFDGQFKQIVGDDLLNENYPLIHAVGRASVHEPRLLELNWGDENAPSITLVGKGICFDSGGLNIKTGNFMRQMKKDMGGAANVLGLARLIMSQNLPVRLRVLIAAAENAIAGNAFRPGDIIKSRKGLSVEIDNTDAEGRLVLCDALDDASSQSPDLIIDFATLTGACRVALGTELPGFFCNDEAVAAGLAESSALSADPIWRLPLHQAYNDMLKSHFADMVNSAETGYGGAITAALYLQKFIANDTPWVHFDVMAWNIRKLPGRPIGGEALGLRATYEYLKQRFA